MGVLDAVRDVRTIKQLLTEAEAEARRDGEEVPGPEHLLLAATTLPDGTAARALARVGADGPGLRTAIEQVHTGALAGAGVGAERGLGATAELESPAGGAFRSTPQAQRVFQQAVALSKATSGRLQGAHVVAAVCDLRHGTVARALTALGVDRERLREAALGELGG